MEKDDAQLIREILSGDDEAFSSLIQRYKKGVHAIAWRELGDFHFAEEITQDVFLQVYKKLSTLRNPKLFSGWLYVITKRLCINWVKKNQLKMESLEEIPTEEIEDFSYISHITDQHEARAAERRSAIVEKLLQKLPESERTVVTLYYLGEMHPNEISRFLGVSENTIWSKIRRARERLQDKEEILISEIFGSVQISPGLMQNIMEGVSNIKPTPRPIGKPLFPWTAMCTSMVFALLGLMVGNQYFVSFQKSYSFNVESEPEIELVDAFIILDTDELIQRNRNENSIKFSNTNGSDESDDTDIVAIAQNKTNEWLDYDVILAGIKYHDELVKSGQAKVVYSIEYTAFPVGHRDRSNTLSGTIIFDSDNIRWDSPSKTIILMPNSSWQVIRYPKSKRKPLYFFAPQKSELPNELIDPRNWLYIKYDQDLSTYLRNENFQIQKTEILKDDQRKDVFCYVLEKQYIEILKDKQADTFTRIWISPERGFRYLKYEIQQPTQVDINDGKIKKGTFMNTRITISHQKFGEMWFPKKGVINTSRIDSDGKKHTIIRQTMETKNCKLNISIPEETFTMDIPDGVEIRVNNRKLSKSELLRQYGQK